MKAIRLISGGLMIISLLAFSGQVSAQNKSKEEKEKELRMAEEIDAQKKAFAEQKRKQEEMNKVAKEAREEVDKAMKEAREKLEEAGIYNEMSKDFRNWSDNPAFKWQQFEGGRYMMTPGMDAFAWQHAGSDSERTDWEYTRSVKGSSFSGTYAMDVRLPSTVVMAVNGECKEGEIKIKIIMREQINYMFTVPVMYQMMADAADARSSLKDIINQGRGKLILDMTNTAFMDSSGLAVLVSGLQAARKRDGDIYLVGMSNTVRALFELTRLHTVFQIYDNEPGALRAFG